MASKKQPSAMTADEYALALAKLGFSDNGAAAKFCGIDIASLRRRLNQGQRIPPEAVILLRLMVRGRVSVEDAIELSRDPI